MSSLLKATTNHGFEAQWEIDQYPYGTNMKTKAQTVEGMPDVKWFLKWEYSQNDQTYRLYLNVQSENEISYTTFFYYFAEPDKLKTEENGKAIGEKDILLESVNFLLFLTSFQNNKLLITIKGHFSYTNTALNYCNRAASAEFGLRLKENFPTDFDIHVDKKIIQIHKHVVAIESPVFAKMFESNFKEAAENKVTITDANFETIQAAIDFCYRQDISDSLQDLTKSINLLFFSDKYDCQTLKPILETHISTKYLSKENISILASTSDQTNSFQLRQKCIDFVCASLNKNRGISSEEIANFDAKFKDAVLRKALQ